MYSLLHPSEHVKLTVDKQEVVKVLCRPMPELLFGVVFNPIYSRKVRVLAGVRGAEVPINEVLLVLAMGQCSRQEKGGTSLFDPVDI